MGTKNNPGKYDCYANADPDEPMFVLLGRDKFAPSLVALWATAREADRGDLDKVTEAHDCAAAMKNWLYLHQKKTADVLDYLPFDMLAAALKKRGATITPAPHGGDEEGAEAQMPLLDGTTLQPSKNWPFPASNPKAA